MTDFDPKLKSVIMNAIGFEMYQDGRPVTMRLDVINKGSSRGVLGIEVNAEEIERLRSLADRVLTHLEIYLEEHSSRPQYKAWLNSAIAQPSLKDNPNG